MDILLERAYWISQISLPFIAVIAAWIAIRQAQSFRLFELIKHIEEQHVREARRIVLTEIPKLRGEEWWKDKRLDEAAALVAAAYGRLGTALRFYGMGRVGRLFVDDWGESIARTHMALEDYLAFRREAAPNSYNGFTWIYEHSKRRHPNVIPPWHHR